MTGRYVLRNKTGNTYYRANRKGSWDNWVDNINLATVFILLQSIHNIDV